MIKIGLVGEAPGDTDSIRNLLRKRFDEKRFEYHTLIRNIRGSQLDNQKTKRLLRIEFEHENPDIVIFTRDLDALTPNAEKITQRKIRYSESNSVVNSTGVFLLNIWELEALILADIETFNDLYNCSIVVDKRPSEYEEPKELLMAESKRGNRGYDTSHNEDVFDNLEFETVLGNCDLLQSKELRS